MSVPPQSGCRFTGLGLKVRIEHGGPVFSRRREIYAAPPHVPCVPGDGAPEDIIFQAQLARVDLLHCMDCSDLGAQSVALSADCCGLLELRLNGLGLLGAAIAKAGLDY